MGYDKILVLAEGAIVEHDTPQNLLANGEDGSEFARLCKESGQYERLASLAKGVSM